MPGIVVSVVWILTSLILRQVDEVGTVIFTLSQGRQLRSRLLLSSFPALINQ